MKYQTLLLFMLAVASSAWAQPFGVITRELPDQVDVYEVKLSSSIDTLKQGDIVKVTRADTVLGEATVLKVSPSSLQISLKGHYSVKNLDSVEFSRRPELKLDQQGYDPYVLVGSEGDSFVKWIYFIDERATQHVDSDTVCFRVKMQSKSSSVSSLNQASFFYYLMHRKSATYESAGEIGPTAAKVLKGTSSPQIGRWGKTRQIARGSMEEALYELAFPDEKT